MPAFLEPVVWVLRLGPEATEYGKPYTASATVVSLGEGACEIRGFTAKSKENATALRRDVEDCLRAAGFTHWRWDRRRKSGVHHVIGDLTSAGK